MAKTNLDRSGKVPYTLENFLGNGGFGTVYKMNSEEVDKVIEIKQMYESPNDFVKDIDVGHISGNIFRVGKRVVGIEKDELVRFKLALNESSIMEIISGIDNVPKMVGYKFIDFKGMFCYVVKMNFVPGEELNYLIDHQQIDPKRTASAIAATAGTLMDLHKLNVIHRDIKPKNIMYDPKSDETTLIDFGLALLEGEKNSGAGTYLFNSPEQLRVEQLTTATDTFSLGITALASLGGVKEMYAEQIKNLVMHYNQENKDQLLAESKRRKNLPEDLVRAIEIAMNILPEERDIKPLRLEALKFAQN